MEGGLDVIVLCFPLHCMLDQLNVLMGLADSSAKWALEALLCLFLLNMTTHHRQPFFISRSHRGNLYKEKQFAAKCMKFGGIFKEKKKHDRPILMMQ